MIWGCMTWEGVGYAAKIDGRMDSDLYLQILKDELLNSLEHMVLILLTSSFSRIMTLSTPPKRSRNGWRSMILGLWCGLHSLLI